MSDKPARYYCETCGKYQRFTSQNRCQVCSTRLAAAVPEPHLKPGFVVVDDTLDFSIEVNVTQQIVGIYFKHEDRGILMTMVSYRNAWRKVEAAFELHHWNRDRALDFAATMLSPENQPPQYTPSEAWEKFQAIMGR